MGFIYRLRVVSCKCYTCGMSCDNHGQRLGGAKVSTTFANPYSMITHTFLCRRRGMGYERFFCTILSFASTSSLPSRIQTVILLPRTILYFASTYSLHFACKQPYSSSLASSPKYPWSLLLLLLIDAANSPSQHHQLSHPCFGYLNIQPIGLPSKTSEGEGSKAVVLPKIRRSEGNVCACGTYTCDYCHPYR